MVKNLVKIKQRDNEIEKLDWVHAKTNQVLLKVGSKASPTKKMNFCLLILLIYWHLGMTKPGV
jgi:hypothetical protein